MVLSNSVEKTFKLDCLILKILAAGAITAMIGAGLMAALSFYESSGRCLSFSTLAATGMSSVCAADGKNEDDYPLPGGRSLFAGPVLGADFITSAYADAAMFETTCASELWPPPL